MIRLNAIRTVAGSVLLAASLGVAGVASADVIEDRSKLMKNIGGSTGAMASMIKGEKPYSAAEMAKHANAIKGYAGQIVGLFPKGSLSPKSEAKAAIWENWDGFKAAAAKLEASAAAVAAASSDRAAATRAFVAMTKDCGGCHTPFRQKKK